MPRTLRAGAEARHTSRYVGGVTYIRVTLDPELRNMRCLLALSIVLVPAVVTAQGARRPPLGDAEISAMARLLSLEDRRSFDSTELATHLSASHPEVRRRAALATGRIFDKRGIALLRARPLDADTAIAATVVFAVGHMRDTSTVAWFDSLLSNPRTPPTVATEAAAALGKIKTASARDALGRYLLRVEPGARTHTTIGEALLAIGRAVPRGDLAPIVRHSKSLNEEVRWRAAWALFRPRDPASVATLLEMSNDASGHVRSWAVRALTKPQADSANLTDKAEARLLAATRDADRRVRTEAIRALGTYTDSAAIAALTRALASTDSWLSVSAAEGLGRLRSPATTTLLAAATTSIQGRPCALRVTALLALQPYAVAEATTAAADIARDTVPYCRTTARQTHFTLTDTRLDPGARRAARLADLDSLDPAVRARALRSMGSWADSSDLPRLFEIYDRARTDTSRTVASAVVAAIAGVQRRHGLGASTFFTRFQAPANALLRRDIERAFGAVVARQAWGTVTPAVRPLDDYRRIVERWIVPDYNGAPRPTARWETPRGSIDLELYPSEAPLGTDDFVRTMESGAILGVEFSRVVPDFVDQQRGIREGNTLRDEVNRHRLTRGNLSWASAGLDTGTPGYTLNHTPQPHNEGDFTSLGRVTRGQDVVDNIQLGDRVTAARMTTPARARP
jgi:cyclophilin family peptidyl-prolyl cis-trans isomerase/HEAT repeat protein